MAKFRLVSTAEWQELARRSSRTRADARDVALCHIHNACQVVPWAEWQERAAVEAVRRLHRVAVRLLG